MSDSSNFHSIYAQGFARVAAATLRTSLADPRRNAVELIQSAQDLSARGVAVALYPELSLSGYSIDDLFTQRVLIEAVDDAIADIVSASRELFPVLVFGAPVLSANRLHNCAVVVHRGRVLGVVPKSYLPTYREFYEARYFASGTGVDRTITLANQEAPFSTNLLFEAEDLAGLKFGIEICEDMWVPVPPGALAALAGANIVLNLSGSPIMVARADDRHLLCKSASARYLSAYAYAAAGAGESTTDLAWDGQTMIYENGNLLAETQRFAIDGGVSVADVDLESIIHARAQQGTFGDNAKVVGEEFSVVTFTLNPPLDDLGLARTVDRFPFVPDDETLLARDCWEAYNIQVAGLEQRLRAAGQPKIVIGVSGGLDSTQALLVAAHTMDRLGRPRSDILAYTMPGFATSAHTRNNATSLALALGCSFETIDIRPAAEQMLRDLGHPYSSGTRVYDITFENVQAGLRTDYLFRLANHNGGIVLGTGDLSELALGWCTFGVGDQMAHYGVNAGIPKTLIQHLIRWVISSNLFDQGVTTTLESILGTEISPELVPAEEGQTPQSTQAVIGPYELQDFTLFHVLRHGARPSRIAFLASHAWGDLRKGAWPHGIREDERNEYSLAQIKHWLEVFVRRFVTSQFKRSTLPNGPKVVAGGSLSPRGDWRMPSDASPAIWLADLETVPDQE